MAATTKILTPAFTFLLLCIVYAFLWMSLCFHHSLPPLGIDVGNLVIDVTPTPLNVPNGGSKDVRSCERVPVSGVSRLKLQHYASVYNVTLVPSVLIPKKWHTKIQVCFHRNSSLGLCQCEKDDWRSLQNGLWVSTMSAYDHKFVDVKFGGMVTGSVTVTLEEVQQIWRHILLAVGIVLLFLAPIVSEWVPFYYASSMVIGIITVVLIILYQARILLPTGRRNSFYLAIVCSVIGAGSFVVHHLSAFLNSVLLNFGISPEIQNLVYYFVGLGIILLGAALGYWLLRKIFISEDGEVYFGVAQFVKWSMFIVAITCIFLSPKDNPLAMVAVGSCLALYHVIAKTKWCYHKARSYSGNRNLWARSKQTTPKHGRAEFLSCSKDTSPLNGMKNSSRWSNSLVKGKVSPLSKTGSACDVYSTYHKTPNRKKFSEEEWEEFTEESTRQSVAELASSPEFTDWVIKNAGRIKLLPEDSLDDLDGSESSSTSEYVQQNGNGPGFFNWFMRKKAHNC
ncbi:hypothetical protein L1987_25410 [Smallanthus sonchifolius]|uniref:Uncharacterized protein n=1 Tax=Smallanthus sonchifolius TaxID=185202 RepID=A0ACB9IMX7_9ASTR|nr:hypothetical protein L1987_25410 [Smallanthus sonchifolius]